MPEKVLNEDWSDYDNRKIRDNRDARFFFCEEQWERDYLIRKIQKFYPWYTKTMIDRAINQCCQSIMALRPREKFVQCVVQRLRD